MDIYYITFFYVVHDTVPVLTIAKTADCRKGSQRFRGRSRRSAGLGDDQPGGRAGNGRYRKHERKGRFAGGESPAPGALELRGAEARGVPPRDQGSLG